jgi:hypothetical protein
MESKRDTIQRVKYWEIIARNLKRRGWSLGYVSALDSEGRTIWIVDAHRDDGRRFVVRADELLSAFEPVFPEKDQAIDYAQNRACFRSGEIHILDSTGKLERTIRFSESDRKL